ncbi:MAG TPA: hypothetical protein PKH70_09985 [Syntrophorhabdaceae bacterium]|nr:hypothetical protein [Pseudomonadota bacterium]OQB72733.1 MAG: hypothetical protein BWX92_03557 [Deltaproteobacteria bacterium ADurb.Bin135]HNQ64285.1 hypothetical protein [Syntrophorhabdaceae bacterium]HOD79589.1 hypothetical protein [Syntrophorhabdus sp.]
MTMIILIIMAFIAVSMFIKIFSAIFTFIAAIFLPILVLVPTVFIVNSLIKGRKQNDIQRYYDEN